MREMRHLFVGIGLLIFAGVILIFAQRALDERHFTHHSVKWNYVVVESNEKLIISGRGEILRNDSLPMSVRALPPNCQKHSWPEGEQGRIAFLYDRCVVEPFLNW